MEAYPLHWPEGWPRTPHPERSRFQISTDRARRGMLEEIRRLVGGKYSRDDVIVSTNLRLRRDGEPYASQRWPEDQGVAVYFQYKGKPMVFACDRWRHIHDNMHAIAKTIEALRGIERWGASDMMERAFTGFMALEHDPEETYAEILQMGNRLGASDEKWLATAERRYKILAREYHPDRPGGSHEMMQKLNWARDQARRDLG